MNTKNLADRLTLSLEQEGYNDQQTTDQSLYYSKEIGLRYKNEPADRSVSIFFLHSTNTNEATYQLLLQGRGKQQGLSITFRLKAKHDNVPTEITEILRKISECAGLVKLMEGGLLFELQPNCHDVIIAKEKIHPFRTIHIKGDEADYTDADLACHYNLSATT